LTPSAPTFEMVSIADRRRQWEEAQADPHHPRPAAVPCPQQTATSPPTKSHRSLTTAAKPAQTKPRRKIERRLRLGSWVFRGASAFVERHSFLGANPPPSARFALQKAW